MFKVYFILLLLGHVLGDFYVQTREIAEKKRKSIKWVIIHCFFYLGTMLLISLPILSYEIALAVIIAAILHLFIDILKFLYLRKVQNTRVLERNIFFIDQVFHLVCLIGIAYWLEINTLTINEWNFVKDFFDVVGISEGSVMSWILALLLIHKPANIIIQNLIVIYKPYDKNLDMKNANNAGRFIGTVERIIMLIFLSIGQYSAIGLVLTAKSIARYDRITKDQDFAEYYLLGTLISTVIAIIIALII